MSNLTSDLLNEYNEKDGLFSLFDKYIKANNNYLPLKAYLKYLENENCLKAFRAICDDQLLSEENNDEKSPNSTQQFQTSFAAILNKNENSLASLAILNNINKPIILTTTTSEKSLIEPHNNKINNKDKDNVVLAQKYYKLIVSIDYSPQTTSLRFIEKSLQELFEKLGKELDEFGMKCPSFIDNEPRIYLTVLLWNNFFLSTSLSQTNVTYKIDEQQPPFIILCHSKLLHRFNLSQMASFLFYKVNESKTTILNMYKSSEKEAHYTSQKQQQQQQQQQHTSTTNVTSFQSPFEYILSTVVKMFHYFDLNNDHSLLNAASRLKSSAVSPAAAVARISTTSALVSSHHIHITDGLLYANDMIKFLERVSTSAITFSYIYSGSSNLLSGSNISCGYGHLPDHYFMKFLTQITNGFYAVVDDNLACTFIIKKTIIEYFQLNDDNDDLKKEDEEHESTESRDQFETNKRSTPSSINSKNSKRKLSDSGGGGAGASYNKIGPQNASKLRRRSSSASGGVSQHHVTRLTSPPPAITTSTRIFKVSEAYKQDQHTESKCLLKYELASKALPFEQLVKFRSLEGFYLLRIKREKVKLADIDKYLKARNDLKLQQQPTPNRVQQNLVEELKEEKDKEKYKSQNFVLITLYFKRYFSQTTSCVYKLNYFASTTPSNIRLSNAKQHFAFLDKYFVEIWLSWSFLHLKAKYQSNVLLTQIKRFLSRIFATDHDTSSSSGLFDLSALMMSPPEILKLKEPLSKLVVITSQQQQQQQQQHYQHQQTAPSLALAHSQYYNTSSNQYPYEALNQQFYEQGSTTASSSHHNMLHGGAGAYQTATTAAATAAAQLANQHVLTVNNIQYELNMRTKKNLEHEFIEFAKSWLRLASLNWASSNATTAMASNVLNQIYSSAYQQQHQLPSSKTLAHTNSMLMNRYLSVHKIKLILEYDRPLPDTNTPIFDGKLALKYMLIIVIQKFIYYLKVKFRLNIIYKTSRLDFFLTFFFGCSDDKNNIRHGYKLPMIFFKFNFYFYLFNFFYNKKISIYHYLIWIKCAELIVLI